MGIPLQTTLAWKQESNLSTQAPFLSDSDGVSTTVEKEHITRWISEKTRRRVHTRSKKTPGSLIKDCITCTPFQPAGCQSRPPHPRRRARSHKKHNLRRLCQALSFVGSPKSFRVYEFLPSTTALWGDRYLLDSLSATVAASLTTFLLFQWMSTGGLRDNSRRGHAYSRGIWTISDTIQVIGISFLLILPVLLCVAGAIHWMVLVDVSIRHYLAKVISLDKFVALAPTSMTGGISEASARTVLYQTLYSTIQFILVAIVWLRVCDAGQALPVTWSLDIGDTGHQMTQDQTNPPIFNPRRVTCRKNSPILFSSSSSDEYSPPFDKVAPAPDLLDLRRSPVPRFIGFDRVQLDQTTRRIYRTQASRMVGKPHQSNNSIFHSQVKGTMLGANYY